MSGNNISPAVNNTELQKVYSQWAKENNNGSLNSKDWGLVQLGANWQKEKLKPLLESHAELLDNLKRIMDRIKENGWSEYIPSAYDRAKLAIEKANNINQSSNPKAG